MQKPLFITALTILVIGAILFFADPYVSEFPAAVHAFITRPHFGWLFLVVSLEALCVFVIITGLLHKHKVTRIIFLIALVLITSIHGAYSSVTKRSFDAFDAEVAEQEAVRTSDALQTYQSVYAGRFAVSILLLGALALLPLVMRRRYSRSFYSLFPLSLLIVFFSIQSRNNNRIVYPTIFSMPAIFLKNTLTNRYEGPRESVSLAVTQKPKPKFIVYLVDESIRGDYLGINGYGVDTTPFLKTVDLLNYGIASSAANCSGTSNLLLRSGLQQNELPDKASKSLKVPSIYAYAKNAGYRSIYIEGQRKGGNLHNYMNRYDMDSIDKFYYMNEEADCKTFGDCFPFEKISEIVKEGKPAFFYVVKHGAHVPYQHDLPQNAEIFTPALAPGEGMTNRERTLNSYYNAIRFSVDEFFRNLLPVLSGKDYIIVYTSDHGQNILENNSNVTHCSKMNAPWTEGEVPLFIATDNADARKSMEEALPMKREHATHYDIFPTLLWLMGYDEKQVMARYGASLKDKELKEQVFYSGDIFGARQGMWNKIRREE